jgi:hypothetical protein
MVDVLSSNQLKHHMKRTYSALAFAALIIAALASCKKDDDGNPSKTPITENPTPMPQKEGEGKARVEINNVVDSMNTIEKLMPPLKLLGIYASGTNTSLTLQSGKTKLPTASTVFNIKSDPNTLPTANEMVVSFYDDAEQTDYYAQSGQVTYTVSVTEKRVKFSNVVFKSESGQTKTISFEVQLK